MPVSGSLRSGIIEISIFVVSHTDISYMVCQMSVFSNMHMHKRENFYWSGNLCLSINTYLCNYFDFECSSAQYDLVLLA